MSWIDWMTEHVIVLLQLFTHPQHVTTNTARLIRSGGLSHLFIIDLILFISYLVHARALYKSLSLTASPMQKR